VQADGKAGGDAAGERERRQAGDIRGHRVSARYICSGSSVFSPKRKAGAGVVGVATASQAAKACSKSRQVTRPHLLRTQVVGVVVAGRQGKGAERDAPLDLGAEAAVARVAVELSEVGSALGAYAVADAVVAREVARGLGGRHEVVGGDRVREVRQLDIDDRGALRPERAQRLLEAGEGLALDALGRETVETRNSSGHLRQRTLAKPPCQRPHAR
jgi:hypothetical protein